MPPSGLIGGHRNCGLYVGAPNAPSQQRKFAHTASGRDTTRISHEAMQDSQPFLQSVRAMDRTRVEDRRTDAGFGRGDRPSNPTHGRGRPLRGSIPVRLHRVVGVQAARPLSVGKRGPLILVDSRRIRQLVPAGIREKACVDRVQLQCRAGNDVELVAHGEKTTGGNGAASGGDLRRIPFAPLCERRHFHRRTVILSLPFSL